MPAALRGPSPAPRRWGSGACLLSLRQPLGSGWPYPLKLTWLHRTCRVRTERRVQSVWHVRVCRELRGQMDRPGAGLSRCGFFVQGAVFLLSLVFMALKLEWGVELGGTVLA